MQAFVNIKFNQQTFMCQINQANVKALRGLPVIPSVILRLKGLIKYFPGIEQTAKMLRDFSSDCRPSLEFERTEI